MYKTQSTSGAVLVPFQKPTSDEFWGAAGWSKLDEFGDRAAPPYDAWGFYPSAANPSVSVIMAQYEPDFRKTTFVTSVLGFTPIGP
jgi:hypothetical protein